MRSFRTSFLLLVAGVSLAACSSGATAPDADAAQHNVPQHHAELREAALGLERLMPGPQVEELLGPPTTNEATPCSRGTVSPRPCRLWRYETTSGVRHGDAVLTVQLYCEMVRKLDIVRALHERGLVTDQDLAAFQDGPRGGERVELCVVDRWQWL